MTHLLTPFIAPFHTFHTWSQAEKLVVKDVVVLIDREQGGSAHLAKNGLNLHAAFKLSTLLTVLVKHGKVRGSWTNLRCCIAQHTWQHAVCVHAGQSYMCCCSFQVVVLH